jgi:hypothetical protein
MAEIEAASGMEPKAASGGDAAGEVSVFDEEPGLEGKGSPRGNGEVFDEEPLEAPEGNLLETFQRLKAEHPRAVSAAAALLVLIGAPLFERRCARWC